MSRTTVQERIPTPVSKYIDFSGKTGKFSYWDKEKKESVEIDELRLLLCNKRATITGWNDGQEARITSGLFQRTTDEISVRSGEQELLRGSYSENKAEIKELGGKYTSVLFCLGSVDGSYEPVAINLTGSALSEWTNFVDEYGMVDVYKGLITATKGDQRKKGAVKFYPPKFTLEEADETLAKLADDFTNNKLAPYLDQ